MKVSAVLVEREDKKQNAVIGCSGLMLDEKFVIVTGNILFDHLQTVLEEVEPGKLYTGLSKYEHISVNVVWKDEDMYIVKQAKIFSVFMSSHINSCNKSIFQNWALDSIDNNTGLNKIISIFFVLSLAEASKEEFKNILKEWWDVTFKLYYDKGDTIYIRSVPFANRNFISSVSKGIVSNIFGSSSCLILSDCPCTPGSEGSPVYLCNREYLNSDIPVGIVLSSCSFWRGEWVGLTLVADIRTIILELIDVPLRTLNTIPKALNPKLIATVECSLAQIYSGKNWGTAILLSQEKGIFITNCHVVENPKLTLYYKGLNFNAELIYRTPNNDVYDLAIVKSDPDVIKNRIGLRSISVSRKKCITGDTVYAAGYSLFPKECDPSPLLSKGCISQVHPSMIKTTCCVHPGSSGGAILDSDGALLGIIVCNAKLENNNMVYPRINMAVPFSAIFETIDSFIKTQDSTILLNLKIKNDKAKLIWKRLEGKL